MQKKLIIFIPSIEGGGVEKNLFIISNYLKDKIKSISVITISNKFKNRFLGKIRFISPVICNNQIRAAISVLDAKDYKGGVLLTSKINIEIKNSEKPALSAEILSLLFS